MKTIRPQYSAQRRGFDRASRYERNQYTGPRFTGRSSGGAVGFQAPPFTATVREQRAWCARTVVITDPTAGRRKLRCDPLEAYHLLRHNTPLPSAERRLTDDDLRRVLHA